LIARTSTTDLPSRERRADLGARADSPLCVLRVPGTAPGLLFLGGVIYRRGP
jgi:hypothetical protein